MEHEIVQMLAGEGETFQEIVKAHEHIDDVEERKAAILTTVYQAIAIRAAFLATYRESGEYYGQPPSIILGQWVGDCIQIEAMLEQREMRKRHVRNMMGLNEN